MAIITVVFVQILVMASDIVLIAAGCCLGYISGYATPDFKTYFTIFGLVTAIALMWIPTRDSGGLFYSWKPSNIRLFYKSMLSILNEEVENENE